ncbi:MAG: prenyltransferase/squalene oxidase repeat-containing protein [Planctomycetota bacterium]
MRSLATLAGGMAAGGTQASGSEGSTNPADLYRPDGIDRAVERGIDFLVKIAGKRDDGAITDRGHATAMTSLAVMAMASIGITPSDVGRRGEAMRKGIDFVLKPANQTMAGYFGAADGSRMYGHGIATLMLTEMLGMGASVEQNERIHDALVDAIAQILAAQSVRKEKRLQGGWRYQPKSTDSDLSISVWQVMALRSAKNDGLDVPGEAIESALGYLENSFTQPRGRRNEDVSNLGGFTYLPGASNPTFSMTAAGLLAMQVCGRYESPMVKASAEWLMRNDPRQNERFFYYGMYYYAQGMHQVGGKYAQKASRLVATRLLELQKSSGAFAANVNDERNIGEVYCTALALLSLTVRYHYLPIYQR